MSLQGIYQASSKGFGFFTPEGAEGRESDLFVPPCCDGWGLERRQGIRRDPPGPQDPDRQTAVVTAVLERRNRTVIGAVERRGREVWVQPSSDRLPHAVKVVGRTSSIRPGDKIAVSMSSFGSAKLPPMGTLKAAFGRDGTRSASVEAILYQYGIERDFPAPVRAAAELAPSRGGAGGSGGRLDLRGGTVITIDGASSKDFDDAVSLERDGDGNWSWGSTSPMCPTT